MFKRIILLTILSVLISALAYSVPLKSWPKEDNPPLTFACPEKEAMNNPPFFNWKQDEDAAEYKINLKNDHDTYQWTTKYNFHTPEKGLPGGKYQVQVVSLDQNGKEIAKSELYLFEIRKKGPGLDIDFSGMSRNDETIYLTSDEMGSLKNPRGLQKHYLELLKDLSEKPDPEWIVNHAEPEPYPEGKFVLSYWQKMNNAAGGIESYMMQKAFMYRISKNRKYAEQAIPVLLDLASWDPYGSTSVNSSDHASFAAIHALSIGYDLFKNELSEEQRGKVREALTLRCEDVYAFLNPFFQKETCGGLMNDPDNNHPWFTASSLGIGGLALMNEVPRAREWASFASQLYCGVFLPRGGSSGGWHEGIDYWAYTLYFVFQFCDVLDNTTGINFYEHPWLSKTALFKAYVHPPEGGYVPFGDCHHKPPNSFDKLVMMRLASRLQDRVCWEYVDHIEDEIKDNRIPIALRWSHRERPGWLSKINPFRKEEQAPKAILFKDIGWAVSNSDIYHPEKQFIYAIHSGKFFGKKFNHSHGDQNHFILTAGGDKLLWDSGVYDGYLTDHHKNYTATSKAHNTILVDGAGQQIFTPGADGKITQFELKDDILKIQADASNPVIYDSKVKKFVRNFEYEIGKSLIISDEIVLAKPGQISWLLHSRFPIKFDKENNFIEITGDHYRLSGIFQGKVTPDLTEGFPIEPGKNKDLVEYHLELFSEPDITEWNPRLTVILETLN